MGANLGLDPLQDDVGGRHHHHFSGIGIESVLARKERLTPNTPAALADQLAVAVVQPGKVFAEVAGVRDDHSHKTNLNHGLMNHLNGGEEPVEVIGAFHQNL